MEDQGVSQGVLPEFGVDVRKVHNVDLGEGGRQLESVPKVGEVPGADLTAGIDADVEIRTPICAPARPRAEKDDPERPVRGERCLDSFVEDPE